MWLAPASHSDLTSFHTPPYSVSSSHGSCSPFLPQDLCTCRSLPHPPDSLTFTWFSPHIIQFSDQAPSPSRGLLCHSQSIVYSLFPCCIIIGLRTLSPRRL